MMDAAGIEDFFAPVGPVSVRRMFSGHGVYVGTACFAIIAFGEIWLKADAGSEPAFEAAGCRPFTMTTAEGVTKTMRAFWSLPDAALDDPDALKHWCGPAIVAAQRAAAAKAAQLTRMRARAGQS